MIERKDNRKTERYHRELQLQERTSTLFALSSAGPVTITESTSSRKARLHSSTVSNIGSVAITETPSSRKKLENHYGKFWRIPRPPMTAYREGFPDCEGDIF